MQGTTRVLDRKTHKHLNPNASHISLQIHLRWAFISGGVDPAVVGVILDIAREACNIVETHTSDERSETHTGEVLLRR